MMSDHSFPGSVSGTYLWWRVHDYRQDFDLPPDVQYDVIYLLATGRFAWLSYWSGYSYGRRAGWFTRQGADIELEGRNAVFSDCVSESFEGESFSQKLQLKQQAGKRVLVGPHREYSYLGFHIFIPFDGLGKHLFPQSWAELDEWVARFVQPRAT